MNIKRIFLDDSKIINLKPTISNILLNKDYNIINLLRKKGKKINLGTPINFSNLNLNRHKIAMPLLQTPPPLNNKNLKFLKKKQLLSNNILKRIKEENEKNYIIYSPKKKFLYRTKSSILSKNYNLQNYKKVIFANPATLNQTLKITHISNKKTNPKINAGTQINDDNIENYLSKTYIKKNNDNKIKCKYPIFKNRTLLYLKKNYDL